MTKPEPLRRCPAVLILLDDRWGQIRDECELDEGHEDEHSIAYTATIPPAFMRWTTLLVEAAAPSVAACDDASTATRPRGAGNPST